MALCIAHTARAMKNVLQRPVARAMLSYSLVRVARAAAPPHASQHARASIPRYLCMLSAGQRGAFCTSAAPGAAPFSTQPIVLVKIGIDGNDRSLSLTHDALIRMDAAALLRSLKVDDAFSVKLKDVPLDDCTVWLLPRVAGKKPTNEEEATAVELEGADTIGDLLTAQRWTPSRLLFLRVRIPASATGPGSVMKMIPSTSAVWSGSGTQATNEVTHVVRAELRLPESVPFDEVAVGDTRMIKAHLQSADRHRYPFFLSLEAEAALRDFVQEEPSKDPRLLLLTGPVKSGKSTVLHEVLPALIADEHRTRGALEPVIFRFVFMETAAPPSAAMRLIEQATSLGKLVGVQVAAPKSVEEALRNLDEIMGNFARDIRERGKQLWFLLDECQAPVLACSLFSDALFFTNTLKALVRTCSPHARIAMTGSGMVTFLNAIRLLPVNGFDLTAAARIVHLGATPSIAAAVAMGTDILQAFADNRKWSDDMRAHVTADVLIRRLDSTDLLSRRPAMLAYAAGMIVKARNPDDALGAAIQDALQKVYDESIYDFVTALANTDDDPSIRRVLHALAMQDFKALSFMSLERKQLGMLRRLCEPAPLEAPLAALRLLPPYAASTKACVNVHGDLIVHWHERRWKIGERLLDLLVFFSEAYTERNIDFNERVALSRAVLGVLSANGVGVKGADGTGSVQPITAAADVLKVPQLASILSDKKNDQELRVHNEQLMKGRSYDEEVGFHVLRWVRNVAAHYVQRGSILRDAKLPPAVVDAAAQAALDELLRLGWIRRHDGTAERPRARSGRSKQRAHS